VKSRLRFDLSFLDMLFNMMLAFAFLFLFSFLLIRPPTESKKAVELKAEMLITLSWPDGALDDIDLWLLLPNGKKVGYPMKDLGVATLDRDDRGSVGNHYIDPSGLPQLIRTHREIITIRALMPGRYVINVHAFAVQGFFNNFESTQRLPYNVNVTVLKLNPLVRELSSRDIMLEKVNQEATVVMFVVDGTGEVVDISTDEDISIVVKPLLAE